MRCPVRGLEEQSFEIRKRTLVLKFNQIYSDKNNRRISIRLENSDYFFRIEPKILWSPLCSQNLSLLVKMEGGFDKNKSEKNCKEKTPVFKKSKFG